MPLSMYDASVVPFRLQLNALEQILAKAQAHAAHKGYDPAHLLQARLFPDMFPLSRQVQIACDMAKSGAARLAGMEPPRHEDNETSFDELRARIGKTLAYIDSVERGLIDGSEERQVVVPLRDRTLKLSGRDYLFGFVLPNLYFHAATAYNILRHNGVELGKKDFLGGA
jgi:uncharacterized protein